RKLAAQALPDMPHNDWDVTHKVAELVDPVEEHHDAILVQPAQNAEQGDIGGRQGLLWCEHHDVDMRTLERAPGDLVAHQIGIVGPRRVDNGGREAELALAKIEISGLDDVGVDAFLLARTVGKAGTDIALEVLRRQQGINVLLAEERVERWAQSQRRATAHLFDVLLQKLDPEARHQALRELADLATAVGKLLPLVGCEKAELGG